MGSSTHPLHLKQLAYIEIENETCGGCVVKKVCARVFALILIPVVITGIALAKTNTTTMLASSANPSTYASSVTFTATVSPSAATGTVTFKDGSTTLGTGTLSSGKATYTTSTLAAGSHSITASYGGNTTYNGSTSSALTQTVNKANSTTTLSSSANPSTYGSSVKFTATVSPSSCTGTVTFKDGSTTLGTGSLSSGKATYSTSTLTAGSHSITGSYAGDSNCNSSTSSALTQTVNKANTTTTLSSSSNPSAFGSTVTFTATVSSTTATGTATFKDGSTTLGTGNVSNGVATYSTSSLAIGSHSITAVYSGDSNYNTSTSSKLTQAVKQGSSVSISSSTNPAPSGAPVTFTAVVTPSAATGTVTFYDSSTSLGSGTLSSGLASLTTSGLAVGSHSITAVYGGDTNYVGSTSSVLTQNIKTLSSISLSPTNISVPVGATQQFMATGTFSDATTGNITASATWTSSVTTVATVSATGVATLLDEGPTTIQAAVASVNSSTTLTGTPSRFRFTGSLNTARDGHTATPLQSGKVLIAGGYILGGKFATTGELYDPAAGTFTNTGSLHTGRHWHTATLLNNGLVLLAGGQGPDGMGGFTWLASAELYDPTAGTFTQTGSLNVARYSHTATLLSNGQVLIVGGNNSTGDPAPAELYDPSTNSFSTTGSLNFPRDGHTATLLNDGTVLIAGGGMNQQPVATSEIYSPASGTFTTAGNMNSPSAGHVAALLSNGRVLIAGGVNPASGLPFARTEIYDPAAKSFALSGSLTTARQLFAGTVLSTGQALMVGGTDSAGHPIATGELYDPTSGTTSVAGNLNNARLNHTATLLNNGLVLIAGGSGPSNLDLATAETYQSTVTEPPPFSLRITPATASIPLGGTQKFTAVDNYGNPRLDVMWTVDNQSLATIATDEDNAVIVTGVAAGPVTLTASAEGVTAQATITVLSSSSFTTGATIWSVPPPAPGFSVLQLVQAVPSANGPDFYSISLSADGTQSIIQALTADGEQMWQTQVPPLNNTSVPDGFGGLIGTEYQTCMSGQTNPMTVVDFDPATGRPLWQLASAGVSNGNGISYCYPAGTAPQIAVGGDGSAYVVEPTNAGLQSMKVSPTGGTTLISQGQTTITKNGQTITAQCCSGPPMVNTDGNMYSEFEYRTIVNDVITSDTLYLYHSDNAFSPIVLSTTTQDEALLPGPVIPDGQGGVLATWTISPSHSVLQFPYQAADVTNGIVGTPYSLPFSPQSVTFQQSPTLVLGENGTAFASGPTTVTVNGAQVPVDEIAAFSLSSGVSNWTYQGAQGSHLSIIASTPGNGLVAKTTDQNSTDNVIRFSASGSVATDSWSGIRVDYYIGTLFTGIVSNNTIQTYSAPPVEFSSSSWFQPQGGGQGNRGAIPALSVTNFSTTGANQTTAQNVLNKIVSALTLPANSGCASWLVGSDGTTGSNYIQSMIQNTAFGHGTFNSITTWAFTGYTPNMGVPPGIAMAINDKSGFYNATDGNGGQFVWGPSKFIYTTWDAEVNTPILTPPRYTGGTLKAQVATLIHETAHGISVLNFQNDNGIQKAGYYNDQFLYQNCHGLIDGIQ